MQLSIEMTKRGERYVANVPTWRGRPIPLTRKAIEQEIERLIELLDVSDGDPDEEDGGDDEPSTLNPCRFNAATGGVESDLEGGSWSEAGSRRGRLGWAGNDDDAELELGWTSAINQSGRTFEGKSNLGWSVTDGEHDAGDDRERDEDSEPSFGFDALEGGDILDGPHDNEGIHESSFVAGGGSGDL